MRHCDVEVSAHHAEEQSFTQRPGSRFSLNCSLPVSEGVWINMFSGAVIGSRGSVGGVEVECPLLEDNVGTM